MIVTGLVHRHRHGLGQGGDGDALPPADEGQVLAEALGLLSALGTRPDHGQAAAEEADRSSISSLSRRISPSTASSSFMSSTSSSGSGSSGSGAGGASS